MLPIGLLKYRIRFAKVTPRHKNITDLRSVPMPVPLAGTKASSDHSRTAFLLGGGGNQPREWFLCLLHPLLVLIARNSAERFLTLAFDLELR